MVGIMKVSGGMSKKSTNFMSAVPEAKDEEMGKELESEFDESEMDKGTGVESSTEEIAAKENKAVLWSKALVVLVIVVVAAAIGTVTLKFIQAQEEKAYQDHFDKVSRELVTFSQTRAREIFDNLEAFSAHVTSVAAIEHMVWPFVVIPDFQVHGVVANTMTGASMLTINPIVKHKDREAWENFTAENQGWMAEAHMYDDEVSPGLYTDERYEIRRSGNVNRTTERISAPSHNRTSTNRTSTNRTRTFSRDTGRSDDLWNVTGIKPFIWEVNYTGMRAARLSGGNWSRSDFELPAKKAKEYYPVWQRAPLEDFNPNMNENFAAKAIFKKVISAMIEANRPVLTEAIEGRFLDGDYDRRFDPYTQTEPHSYLLQPIYDSLKNDRQAVGVLSAFFRWGLFFKNVLPEGEDGVMVFLNGTCGQSFTYELQGKKPVYLGQGDLIEHDDRDMRVQFEVAPFATIESSGNKTYCQYQVEIYPSAQFKAKHFTNDPYLYAGAVVSCFVLTTLVFVIYDCMVRLRNKRVMETATKSHAIVSQLFPSNVRDRLMNEVAQQEEDKQKKSSKNAFLVDSSRSADITSPYSPSEAIFGSKPIADLFPESTIMFADMVGFTAWSSVREPSQVFSLLETVYHSFDAAARRMRVFKVETIGDCYVAVCGVPTYRKTHATVMARFACFCATKMVDLCRDLEMSLGPGTDALRMRVGLHSGPVTAGVLRGDKGRFQLFGDTMNSAARMESTGVKDKVQVSQATADLLFASGKGKWLTEREGGVEAKGKGKMKTFFCDIREESVGTGSMTMSTTSFDDTAMVSSSFHNVRSSSGSTSQKQNLSSPSLSSPSTQRLIQWNVDILSKLLRRVMARAQSKSSKSTISRTLQKNIRGSANSGTLLDEVKEVLNLPKFDPKVYTNHVDPESIQLSDEVKAQMISYVTDIAGMYSESNSFHCFDHASHVMMSVIKLMSRINSPIEVSMNDGTSNHKIAENLHDHTFGITSDPLTQFSVVLAAMIHDVDHPGVPNSTLVSENDPISIKYSGKSVAEQNSVELAWERLMLPQYEALRACIYTNDEELDRFRQTLLQLVLATDVIDKDLGAKRKDRWAKAFSPEGASESAETKEDATNRKATIVLEHLLQASDVSHTMQHWQVYVKWNERLFQEMYSGYKASRLAKNPAEAWYEGELGFFDYYIIPLAKKLETCGVFGVSSHEYLSYASMNREEWKNKGRDIVKQYLANIKAEEAGRLEGSEESSVDTDVDTFTDEVATNDAAPGHKIFDV